MEKEKLIELSKQYFDNNKDLKQIIASSDGHFFYTEPDASYHVAKNNIVTYIIKRSDLEKPVEKVIVKEKIEVKKEVEKQPVKKAPKKTK